MEDEILQYLARHPKHAATPRELAQRLRVPPENRPLLRKKLKELALHGKILRVRGDRYSSRYPDQTVTGTFKMHYEGYGFVLPQTAGQTDVFIPAKYRGNALPGDTVLASFFHKKGEARREGKILEVIKRGRSRWIGRLERRGKAITVINEEFAEKIEIHVAHDKLKGARLGQIVVAAILSYPARGGPMTGQIDSVLGEPLDENTEVAAILYKHGVQKKFPDKVTREVDKIPPEIPDEEIKRRVDLTSRAFITIDGLNARDFDDAIYAERRDGFVHLYVSIADVASYVPSGSAADQEALARGTSVYFPDFAVPMLPEKLSNNLCSLKPGEDRLSLTCEIRFTEEGEAVEAWFYESIIKSQKRGIYENIQQFLDRIPFAEETMSEEIVKSLVESRKLAQALMAERTKRGAIEFDLPEAEVVYNRSGEIEAIVTAKRFFSHRLIEECMSAANVAVASLFHSRGIPVLYRVHDSPDPVKLEEFLRLARNLGFKLNLAHPNRPKELARFIGTIQGHPAEGLLHYLLLRCMRIAVYSPENLGHFGLGLHDYCHFTSPIRRYPDLVVHRQLKGMIGRSPSRKLHLDWKKWEGDGGESSHGGHKESSSPSKVFYTFRDLQQIGALTSKREREAMEAEREMLDLKKTLFMQNHLQDKFFGTIRRITHFGMFVELEPHAVEGLLHVRELKDDYYLFDDKRIRLVGRKKRKKIYQVGGKIWVRVKEVSMATRTVLLELP